MKKVIVTLQIAFLSLAAGNAQEKQEPASEPAKFFRTQILPILEKRCFECHSGKKEMDDGGLVLDTKAGWVKGGDHGPAVVPYNLKKSRLIRTIRSQGGNKMPPEEDLTPAEITLLSTWVLLGAPDPRPE
ncbi:c-type cytochrome domain-containing protein [Verrucomicrobiaceae bacterium 227]